VLHSVPALPPPPPVPPRRIVDPVVTPPAAPVAPPVMEPVPPVESAAHTAPTQLHLPPDVGTAALVHDFEHLLKKPSSIDNLVARLRNARGQGKQRLARLVEHLRLLYQLKVLVQVESLKQKKSLNQAQLNKWVVSTYKVVGFAVLSVIVFSLLSYLGSNLFYFWSTHWLEPTIISATDDRVLALSSKLAEVQSQRDRIAADLADADRVITMQEDFLKGAQQALADELADRQSQLKQLHNLNKTYASTRVQVRNANRTYAGMSRKRIAAEYQARLIDREAAVSGAFQLSQIAQGSLSLAEKGIELDKRTGELERETAALEAGLSQQGAPVGGKLSYEVVRTLQDVKRSQVELAKARDNRTVLAKSLQRYELMVKTIAQSPYLLAVEKRGTIAFVPYENLDNVKAGTPLYSCSVGLFFCRNVGQVVEVLGGELSVKHPLHNNMLRGQSVQVQLTDVRAAEHRVLFAGGRPILF
jgi:hypothetical protein